MNAPVIPPNHWLHDDKLGGGRIIGEGCHFIDLIAHIAQSTISTIRVVAISQQKGAYLADDNVIIHLTLSDGSAGTITYTTLGNASYPKETLTIFSDGAVLSLDDFRTLNLYRNGRKKNLYHGTMDKGFDAELSHVLSTCRKGQSATEVESYFHSSLVAILAQRSLRTGRTVSVTEEPVDCMEANADSLH